MAKRKKSDETSNWKLAEAQYKTILESKKDEEKVVRALSNSDLETIANESIRLIKDSELRSEDKKNYSAGIKESTQKRDFDTLLGAYKTLHQLTYGKANQTLERLFGPDEIEKTIASSTKEFQLSMAMSFYTSDYKGGYKEIHEKQKQLIYRGEGLGLLTEDKKPVHNSDLTKKQFEETIYKEYQDKRESYEDENLDNLAKTLDVLFGIPFKDYFNRLKELEKELTEEVLPNNPGYLASLASKEKLIEYFVEYNQTVEKSKQKVD